MLSQYWHGFDTYSSLQFHAVLAVSLYLNDSKPPSMKRLL